MTPKPTPPGDLKVLRRAGRMVALQTALALAAMLVVVGAVVTAVYLRTQNTQITSELTTVAENADDADDPPPGTELALRDNEGRISTSDGGQPGVALLSGPAGFSDLSAGGRQYRALVVDRDEGRVAALMDLAPYRASRNRLALALALAELVGILVAVAVVALFTRRSVRPLAEALSRQRRFVADASHELRAPLTVLHTRAQLLAHRLESGDLAGARNDANAVVADTRNLSGVVDDLLASATMAADKPDGVRVDLATVGHSVCESMGPYADSIGVRLHCGCDEEPGAVDVVGSEAALRRAFTALVDNALGHEHEGGTVQLRIRRDGQQVIASVADDGAGIDEATMARLFDRFSHGGGHSTKPGRPSYGIGLSLVREIIQAHRGDIRVSSNPGEGATFTVSLPAA